MKSIAIYAVCMALLGQPSTAQEDANDIPYQGPIPCLPETSIPIESLVTRPNDPNYVLPGAKELVKVGIPVSSAPQKRSRGPHFRLAHRLRPRQEAGPPLEAVDGGASPMHMFCDEGEMCLSWEGTPFCYMTVTGAYHDVAGTVANAITGDYTLIDGRGGNVFDGPHPIAGDADAPPPSSVPSDDYNSTYPMGTATGSGTGTGAMTSGMPWSPSETGTESTAETELKMGNAPSRAMAAGSMVVAVVSGLAALGATVML